MKKNITLLILTLIYISFWFIAFVFSDTMLGTYIHIAAIAIILIFWILPLVYFQKKKNLDSKKIILLAILNIFIYVPFTYFSEKYGNEQKRIYIEKLYERKTKEKLEQEKLQTNIIK